MPALSEVATTHPTIILCPVTLCVLEAFEEIWNIKCVCLFIYQLDPSPTSVF